MICLLLHFPSSLYILPVRASCNWDQCSTTFHHLTPYNNKLDSYNTSEARNTLEALPLTCIMKTANYIAWSHKNVLKHPGYASSEFCTLFRLLYTQSQAFSSPVPLLVPRKKYMVKLDFFSIPQPSTKKISEIIISGTCTNHLAHFHYISLQFSSSPVRSPHKRHILLFHPP